MSGVYFCILIVLSSITTIGIVWRGSHLSMMTPKVDLLGICISPQPSLPTHPLKTVQQTPDGVRSRSSSDPHPAFERMLRQSYEDELNREMPPLSPSIAVTFLNACDFAPG
jgi:hypothetical protein